MADLRQLDLTAYSREYTICGRPTALAWIEREFGLFVKDTDLIRAIYYNRGGGRLKRLRQGDLTYFSEHDLARWCFHFQHKGSL